MITEKFVPQAGKTMFILLQFGLYQQWSRLSSQARGTCRNWEDLSRELFWVHFELRSGVSMGCNSTKSIYNFERCPIRGSQRFYG